MWLEISLTEVYLEVACCGVCFLSQLPGAETRHCGPAAQEAAAGKAMNMTVLNREPPQLAAFGTKGSVSSTHGKTPLSGRLSSSKRIGSTGLVAELPSASLPTESSCTVDYQQF